MGIKDIRQIVKERRYHVILNWNYITNILYINHLLQEDKEIKPLVDNIHFHELRLKNTVGDHEDLLLYSLVHYYDQKHITNLIESIIDNYLQILDILSKEPRQ